MRLGNHMGVRNKEPASTIYVLYYYVIIILSESPTLGCKSSKDL